MNSSIHTGRASSKESHEVDPLPKEATTFKGNRRGSPSLMHGGGSSSETESKWDAKSKPEAKDHYGPCPWSDDECLKHDRLAWYAHGADDLPPGDVACTALRQN